MFQLGHGYVVFTFTLAFALLVSKPCADSSQVYTVGYVIGQIPSNLLLTRVSPRWVIPMVCVSAS